MRRMFVLPEEDTDFLNSLGLQWETLRDSNVNWVIIKKYPLPKGYNNELVDISIEISNGYPTTQIDMVYFNPAIHRADGVQIKATQVNRMIDGISWQRWSRHRTPQNPWRPGIDNLAAHYMLIEYWLKREFSDYGI